jgi:hypothetical protein
MAAAHPRELTVCGVCGDEPVIGELASSLCSKIVLGRLMVPDECLRWLRSQEGNLLRKAQSEQT